MFIKSCKTLQKVVIDCRKLVCYTQIVKVYNLV